MIHRKPTAMNTIIIVTLLLVGVTAQCYHNSENEDSPNQEPTFSLSHKTLDANNIHKTMLKNIIMYVISFFWIILGGL